jgi:hypothetical protein
MASATSGGGALMRDQEIELQRMLQQNLQASSDLMRELRTFADEVLPAMAAGILSRFSQALIEKDIHQMVTEAEEQKKRQKRLRKGGFRIGKDGKAK